MTAVTSYIASSKTLTVAGLNSPAAQLKGTIHMSSEISQEWQTLCIMNCSTSRVPTYQRGKKAVQIRRMKHPKKDKKNPLEETVVSSQKFLLGLKQKSSYVNRGADFRQGENGFRVSAEAV